MKTLQFQRGQFLVAGIVLLVVIALMIATLGYLYVSGESSGSLHGQSERAYFAARSGIEYSSGQYFNGTACSSLTNAGGAVGTGGATFALTPTLFAPLAPTATSAATAVASTSIPVTSTAGYSLTGGRILIDSELINYTSATGTTFDGLTRGANGTTAAAHALGATVSQNVCVVSSLGTAGSTRRTVRAAIGAGNLNAPGAMGTMGVDAMVAYAKGTSINAAGFDRNVYFRLWDPSTNNWGAEQTAQQVSNTSSPVFISVQFARTRNEAIMGVLDGNNNIYIQVWNGRTWTIPAGGGPLTTGSTLCASAPVVANSAARCFQIAYEYTSDIARIVYQNNTRDPQYATWNGTTLTANGLVLSPTGTYSSRNSGSAKHLWFRLAPRNVVGSNDMLLMTMDDSQDIYGARWTGAAWNSMGAATGNANQWDTSTTNGNTHEAIDVAWQSNGALAVFVYGDANSNRINYRTWTAATSTLSGLANTIPARPGGYGNMIFEWIRLYPDQSNNILVVAQADTRSLVSTYFSGGVPIGGTYIGHDNAAVESRTSRSFDFAWEKLPSAPGNGWLLWGSSGSGAVRQRYFTSPATWAGIGATVLDNTLLVQQGALSPSGRFVAGMYQSTASATQDIVSGTTTGGGTAWPNVSTQLWAGSTTNIQQGERVYVVTREGARINTGASGTGVVSILQTGEVVP